MSRTIVLLDVTAMSGENVCVAGIDLDTGATLRLSAPQPTRGMLRRFGGLVPGDVIRVDWRPVRKLIRPHVEDGVWKPQTLKKLPPLGFDEIIRLVSDHAFPSIEAAFGPPSTKGSGGNHAWPPGQGERSLATLRVRYARAEAQNDRLRVALRDQSDAFWGSVPFQDLIVRSHAAACTACGDSYVSRVRAEFDCNAGLIRVGLTRPFPPNEQQGDWLQVTNIFARPRQHFT